MVIMKGASMALDATTRAKINASTDPTWPHVHAKLNCSFEQFLSVFPCNHVMGTVGDKVRALTYLCEISGITPIVLGPEAADRMPPIWELVR
jgi:L-fucose isomerase